MPHIGIGVGLAIVLGITCLLAAVWIFKEYAMFFHFVGAGFFVVAAFLSFGADQVASHEEIKSGQARFDYLMAERMHRPKEEVERLKQAAEKQEGKAESADANAASMHQRTEAGMLPLSDGLNYLAKETAQPTLEKEKKQKARMVEEGAASDQQSK